MTVEQLAREVVAVLDAQARYFKTRSPAALSECKAAERELRKRCDAVLNPRQVQPEIWRESDKL